MGNNPSKDEGKVHLEKAGFSYGVTNVPSGKKVCNHAHCDDYVGVARMHRKFLQILHHKTPIFVLGFRLGESPVDNQIVRENNCETIWQ
jgi:hypothetical protein